VSGAAPLVNPGNANTSTTLNAPALENLPSPGEDLTYPLQFAPGALMNTPGSGNDFVGSSNGYATAMLSSTDCQPYPTAISSMGWRQTIRLPISVAAFPQILFSGLIRLRSDRQHAFLFRGSRPRSRNSLSPLYRYGENSGDSMHAKPHCRTSCHYQFRPLNPFLSNDRVKREDFPEVARLPWAQEASGSNPDAPTKSL
jgi:hypothetical protein